MDVIIRIMALNFEKKIRIFKHVYPEKEKQKRKYQCSHPAKGDGQESHCKVFGFFI